MAGYWRLFLKRKVFKDILNSLIGILSSNALSFIHLTD